jgi:hypothetical protein
MLRLPSLVRARNFNTCARIVAMAAIGAVQLRELLECAKREAWRETF